MCHTVVTSTPTPAVPTTTRQHRLAFDDDASAIFLVEVYTLVAAIAADIVGTCGRAAKLDLPEQPIQQWNIITTGKLLLVGVHFVQLRINSVGTTVGLCSATWCG